MNKAQYEDRLTKAEQALGIGGECRLLFAPSEYKSWTEEQQAAWVRDQGVKPSDKVTVVVFDDAHAGVAQTTGSSPDGGQS